MPETSRASGADRSGGDFWSGRSSAGPARSLDPLAWFRSILQYKWPILLATALVTALAVAYTMTATPLYRSTQSLLLESTRSNIVGVEELIEDGPEDIGYVQTQIEVLRSRELAGRVIESLGLLSDPTFVAGLVQHAGIDTELPAMPATKRLAVEFLRSRLSINQVPTTRLLRISFLSPDAQLAANVANEIGQQYVLDYVESKRLLVGEVSGWLDERLSDLKDTLEASERRLLLFKSENGLIDIDGGIARLDEQGLLRGSSELEDAELELARVSELLQALRAETDTQGLLAQLPALRVDPLMQQTRVDIGRLRREIDRLSNQYGPRHPSIVERQTELDTLQGVLAQSLRQAVAAIENEQRLLQRKVSSLESGLAEGKQAIQSTDAKAVELAALTREVQTNRDLYYRFFGRMIESRSTEGLEPVNATVVEYATPSLAPAKPDKAFIIALTALGALFCATLAAMIVSGLDDSVKSRAVVEDRLGMPLLGVVPRYRRPGARLRRTRSSETADDRSGRMFVEAFRTLRTNLLLGHGLGDRKIVLLTSSVPKEGKSMSSIGLAGSFAQLGRVLLIDADIRRPSLAGALKIDASSPGLTDVLDGSESAQRCIQRHPSGGFDVLPSGPPSDHSLELLSGDAFRTLLEDLAPLYDRIVIDCAPVEAVSDALLLSRLADAVIYVIKSHDTSQRLAARGIDKLRSVDAPLVGVLLTQVDIDRLVAYGADQEFHGYYDYYDYTTPEAANRSAPRRVRERAGSSTPRDSRSVA